MRIKGDMMEDKREFNDILIDDRAQYQNRSKKIMLLVVAAAALYYWFLQLL